MTVLAAALEIAVVGGLGDLLERRDFRGTSVALRLYFIRSVAHSAAQNVAQNVSWGGSTILCTRNVKFELSDHKDCGSNGLTATGFATVELTGSSGTTVQFK